MTAHNMKSIPGGIDGKISMTLSYDNLKAGGTLDNDGIVCNKKFLAYIDTTNAIASSIAVLPLSNTGRSHQPNKRNQPLIRGHSAPVKEFSFDPFRDDVKNQITLGLNGPWPKMSITEVGFNDRLSESRQSTGCGQQDLTMRRRSGSTGGRL